MPENAVWSSNRGKKSLTEGSPSDRANTKPTLQSPAAI